MSVWDENNATVYRCRNCNKYYSDHFSKEEIEEHTSGRCNSLDNPEKNNIIEVNFSDYSPPDWDSWFMEHVYLAAKKSKDPKTKIGAILVKDNKIISTGFNGFCMGVKDFPERYNHRETKHSFVAHAEANSILSAARFGISTLGSTLYSQGIVCHECCKSAIQAGVKELIVHRQWPNLIHNENWVKSIEISKIMLKEAGIKIRWLDKVLGVKGYLDGKIINV